MDWDNSLFAALRPSFAESSGSCPTSPWAAMAAGEDAGIGPASSEGEEMLLCILYREPQMRWIEVQSWRGRRILELLSGNCSLHMICVGDECINFEGCDDGDDGGDGGDGGDAADDGIQRLAPVIGELQPK